MLSITILTLLITSNVISRIQAVEQEERKALFNGRQTPVYGSDVIESLKVQKRDTLNTVPESYVEQTNHADKSQSGNRLRRDDKTGSINYLASRTFQYNVVYDTDVEKDVLYGSEDVIIGTHVSGDPNTINVYAPTLVQVNMTYPGNNESARYGASVTHIGNSMGKNDILTSEVVQKGITYLEKNKNKTLPAIGINQSHNTYPEWVENNKDASGNFFPFTNDSEAGMNTKNNTEGQVDIAQQNATDSQENSSSTNYDSSSHIENKTLYNKEKEAYADKHTEFNRQMSLSPNVFYSLSFSLIILLKYS